MTTSICNNANINDTTQLIDRRDSKKYWVAKLADNNCWMVQNLDLDIPANGLTATLSDMASDWNNSATYPPVATSTTMSGWVTTNSSAGYSTVQSYNPGIRVCNIATGCNTPTGSDYDTHYLTGNYYSWTAATAGSNNTAKSICPKNWALPTGSGYSNLLLSYGEKVSVLVYGNQNIMSEPLYFVPSGAVSGANTLSGAGTAGFYWSSTVSGGTAYGADSLSFYISPPSFSTVRYDGFSVRCVAR